MNATITRRFACYVALPAVSAEASSAAPRSAWPAWPTRAPISYEPTPRPGIVATPNTIARPPVVVVPGHRWHHHHGLVIDLPAGE